MRPYALSWTSKLRATTSNVFYQNRWGTTQYVEVTGKASYSFSSYSVVLGAVAGDEVKSRQVWQPLPQTAPHHGNQQRFSAGAEVSTDGIDAPYSCRHVVSERHLGSR
jgi:hypothetical protein